MKKATTAFLLSLAVAAGAETIQMPPGCTTPDGMVIDPQGRLVIAAPTPDFHWFFHFHTVSLKL